MKINLPFNRFLVIVLLKKCAKKMERAEVFANAS